MQSAFSGYLLWMLADEVAAKSLSLCKVLLSSFFCNLPQLQSFLPIFIPIYFLPCLAFLTHTFPFILLVLPKKAWFSAKYFIHLFIFKSLLFGRGLSILCITLPSPHTASNAQNMYMSVKQMSLNRYLENNYCSWRFCSCFVDARVTK